MYSLALLLWELVACERPWQSCTVMEVAFKITKGFRPPLNHLGYERCPPKLKSLIQKCWDADPRRRPAAAEVVKSLTLIQQVGTGACGGRMRRSFGEGAAARSGRGEALTHGAGLLFRRLRASIHPVRGVCEPWACI